jgi:hypothetical protein
MFVLLISLVLTQRFTPTPKRTWNPRINLPVRGVLVKCFFLVILKTMKCGGAGRRGHKLFSELHNFQYKLQKMSICRGLEFVILFVGPEVLSHLHLMAC